MTTAQISREVSMFGCTEADLRQSIESSITFKFTGPAMVAMSYMSDAQEEMAHGMTERARQTINCAKWIIATYMMENK